MVKIAHFPPIQQFATFYNEGQSGISVRAAVLHWIAGLAISTSSIHVYSIGVDIGKMCFTAQHVYFCDGAVSPSAVESR